MAGVAIYTHVHRLHTGAACWLILVDEALDNTAVGTDLHSNVSWWTSASRRVEWGAWSEARLADRLGQALRGRNVDLSVQASLAGFATASLLLGPPVRWDGRRVFEIKDVMQLLLGRTRLSAASTRDVLTHLAALRQSDPGRLEWTMPGVTVKVVFRARGTALASGRQETVVSRYRATHLSDTQGLGDSAIPVLVSSSEGQLAKASDALLQWAFDHSLTSAVLWEQDLVGREGIIDLRLRWYIPVTHERVLALRRSTEGSSRAAKALGVSLSDIPIESIAEGSLVARTVPTAQAAAVLFLSHVLDQAPDIEAWLENTLVAPAVRLAALGAALQAAFFEPGVEGITLSRALRIATDRLMVRHGLTSASLPLDSDVTSLDVQHVLESPDWFACSNCFEAV